MLDVPRHRFIPGVSLEDAYSDRALAIKEHDGLVVSSISQPSMVAQMLSLLAVHPGDRVLEIGAGSGYNAALLARLAGSAGRVVTVDIEDDLLHAARERFNDLGYAAISVVHADDVSALAGPFERIVVTARSDDIDPQWWRLLDDGGRLVVPLDIGYGGERAVGFIRYGARLRSVGSYACAFIGMRTSAHDQPPAMFFRNRHVRFLEAPTARTDLEIIALRPGDATPELLAEADTVVARPATLFAITRSES